MSHHAQTCVLLPTCWGDVGIGRREQRMYQWRGSQRHHYYLHWTIHNAVIGTVFEKKQLMACLALGEVSWNILTYEGDTGNREPVEGSIHPQEQNIAKRRDTELSSICRKLAEFDGDRIDLYIMAPGHGNISAIITNIRAQWPLKCNWRLSMYTGSFNTRGMTESDLEAIGDIMKCSDSPLVARCFLHILGNISQQFENNVVPHLSGLLHFLPIPLLLFSSSSS